MSGDLAQYRQRITAALFPDGLRALCDYGAANREAARQVIADYRQHTADLAGDVDLLLTYVEAGTGFTLEYGDIDEEFYEDLSGALGEAAVLLHSANGASVYPRFEERLRTLARRAQHIGWGYSDLVHELVEAMAMVLGEGDGGKQDQW